MNPELAEAAAMVWGVTIGRQLADRGCPPTLVWLTAQIRASLPPGPAVQALVGFVLRNQWALAEMVDTAFRQASPPGGPLDATPPQVGVLHRSMSLAESEDAMRGEPEEHVVIIDATTGVQIARFGPGMTRAQGREPVGCTVIDVRLNPFSQRSGAWIMSHNHPSCGTLSTADLLVAAAMNLQEMRAVCADGWAWSMKRPANGWPDQYTIRDMADESYYEAYQAASGRYCLPARLSADAGSDTPYQEPSDEWTRHFNLTFLNTINRQGRGLGMRMQGDGPAGSGPTWVTTRIRPRADR
ncbi:MAG: hypothetical protein ACI8RZ_007411 [Myxococcota bacterium]|jgi:hypothetical protein